jgi:hypothetical protein
MHRIRSNTSIDQDTADAFATSWTTLPNGSIYTYEQFEECPSSMRKCNTWRNGLMAGTLGGYGKRIQAHQS